MIGSGFGADEPAHTLYIPVGFTEYELSEPWQKKW